MATLETWHTSTAFSALEETRIIRAPRGRVWEAWTRPEMLKQWFGPAHMHCPNAELNVYEGGSYRIDVHPNPDAPPPLQLTESARREAAATGTYTKVVPNELLQFTWVPSWLPQEESLVTITLQEVEGGTNITLRHERFLCKSSREGYERGWSGSLAKLATQLEV